MPNVRQMSDRLSSHLARVSGKALEREADRINALLRDERISPLTAHFMRQSAAIRLAWKANAS
jgi:hypothetical protein